MLDTTGRLACLANPTAPETAEGVGITLFPTAIQAERASECILLAQIAGTLSCLFTARLQDATCRSNDELVDHYLRQPARLNHDQDTLTITMPESSIDLSVRRGGLVPRSRWDPLADATGRFAFME